jgi:ribosomal protein L32E
MRYENENRHHFRWQRQRKHFSERTEEEAWRKARGICACVRAELWERWERQEMAGRSWGGLYGAGSF